MPRLHLVLATLACAAAGSAHALTCYTVFDRTDAVVYRDSFPPVDMSPEGDAQRDTMRASGQFLMFVDAETCPAVQYRFGDAGTKNLSVDNIIGDIRPMTIMRPGVPAGAPGSVAPGVAAPTPPARR